jgi:serine/threonine protein kinase
MDENIAGRYTLQQSIGKGAMGEVFQGLDLETGKPVAIKVLRSDVVAQQPEMITRFIREGQLLRDLNHPNIVRYLDIDTLNGQHFLVMEYVRGGSLKDYLQQHAPLAVDAILRISLELADALTRAHHLDIIHRDLKPDNVLLAEDGTPRLSDFGLARPLQAQSLSESHHIMGTPHYLSPEMLQGEDIDARVDIWAFGVMLYEMLAGIRPFRGDNMAALLTCILTTPPQPELDVLRPDMPVALVDLVYRMLAKQRAERIPSCRHVGVELWNIMQGIAPQAISQRIVEGTFSLPRGPFTPRRTNLPAEMTPFVGRQHELALLKKLMADPDRRLVTIKGVGGMGKSRLALEFARRHMEQFTHGAFFVELAPLTQTIEIIPAIASAVDLPFAPGVDASDDHCHFPRKTQSAGRDGL